MATRQYEAHFAGRNINKEGNKSLTGKRKAEGAFEKEKNKTPKYKNKTWVNNATTPNNQGGGRGRRISPQEKKIKDDLQRLQQQLEAYKTQSTKKKRNNLLCMRRKGTHRENLS